MRQFMLIGWCLLLVAAVAGCNSNSNPPTSRFEESSGPPPEMKPPEIPDPTAAAPLKLTPRAATPAELKHALAELSEGFRQGLTGSDEEIATQLGLRVWAFDFTGGPFGAWFEVSETGQLTFDERHPIIPGANLICDETSGKLLVWLQPRATPQMSAALRERVMRNQPQVPNWEIGVDCNSKSVARTFSHGNPSKPFVPLWFGWKDANVKELSEPVTVNAGDKATLLRIEATEKGVAKPRKVKFELNVKK